MAGKRCIIPVLRARGWIAALCFVSLAAGAALLFLPSGGGRSPGPSLSQTNSKSRTRYEIALRLDDENHTLAMTETVFFRNDTGDTLENLALRTWLNAFSSEETSPAGTEEFFSACYGDVFSPGSLSVYDVIWNGERTAYAYANEDQTALMVEIGPLLPGEEGTLFFRCVASLPACAYRTGYTEDAYQLGNVIPLLSRYEEGAWRTDPYSPIGDPFLSDCADFSLTLYAPEGYVPACSADLKQAEPGLWRGEISSARDIGLCLGKAYQKAAGVVGGVQVYSYAPTREGAERALQYAVRALDTFSQLYGEYPYPSYTVCSAVFPFGGAEYPGFSMVSREQYGTDQADTLELTVAHETAHQWFYALVGSDQVNAPWQDEALCEWAVLRYVLKRYGQGSYENLRYYRADAAMRVHVPGKLTPGSPIGYFSNLSDYATVVYGRGAALMVALNECLPQGLDDFLREYAKEFAFQYASRAQFEEFLNRYAGMDVSPLLLDYLDTAMDE